MLYVNVLKLFRNNLVVENVRRIYFNKIRLQYFTKQKLILLDILQNLLTKSFYLIHSNTKKQSFINFNVNKKFDFNIILYYIKKVFRKNHDKYSSQHVVQSIFFLLLIYHRYEIKILTYKIENNRNRLSIEKKTRYVIKATFETTIIYTNYNVIIKIVKQITLTIIFIDKLNFRLIRAFDYI